MPTPVLVLRDPAETATLVARLRGEGVDALAAPCIAYEAEPPDEAFLAPLRGIDLDLLVTSPRSVPTLLSAHLPDRWRILALAPTTSRALAEAGIRVDLAVGGGGAALAGEARPGPLLLATSDLGGDEVRRVRPDVTVWVTYRTVCPVALPDEAVAALAGDYDLLAASPSQLRHLDALAPGAVARARAVYCHGGTTLDEAVRLGGHALPHRLADPLPPR